MYCSLTTPLFVNLGSSMLTNDTSTGSGTSSGTVRTRKHLALAQVDGNRGSPSTNNLVPNNNSKKINRKRISFGSDAASPDHHDNSDSPKESIENKHPNKRVASLRLSNSSSKSSPAPSLARRKSQGSSSLGKKSYKVSKITRIYHDYSEGILGCKHYHRSCQIFAPCCGKAYTCKFCHDEANPMHKIDVSAIQTIACMKCSTVQSVKQNCEKCGETFGEYFCEECRLFSSDKTKSIFHCNDCGICRIGKGPGIDVFHCKKCQVCMDISLQRSHKCVERSLDSNCPICTDFLKDSTDPVIFLKCGHSMHTDCFEQYSKTSYTCPICWKSMGDMADYFAKLDRLLQTTSKPSNTKKSIILCNDCEKKSCTASHMMYHKCGECGSYNTKVLHQFISSSASSSSAAATE